MKQHIDAHSSRCNEDQEDKTRSPDLARSMFTKPAINVSTAPIPSPIRRAASIEPDVNSKVISTAPAVWPVSRAMPCMPPAAPLRLAPMMCKGHAGEPAPPTALSPPACVLAAVRNCEDRAKSGSGSAWRSRGQRIHRGAELRFRHHE